MGVEIFESGKKESRNGISEIKVKAGCVAPSERWQRATFKHGKRAQSLKLVRLPL
jgi:hypothetical protein